MDFKKFLLAAAVTVVSSGASAAFVNDGSEANLNEIINGTLIVDGTAVNVLGDTDTSDATTTPYFKSSGDGDMGATFLIEVTGGMSNQTFGIFNGDDYVQLFGANDQGVFTVDPLYTGPVVESNAAARVSFDFFGGAFQVLVNNAATGVTFNSDTFGFYLGNANGPLIYSDNTKNANDTERFVAVQGQGQKVTFGSNYNPGCDSNNLANCDTWESDEWLVAFEDGSDFDFNDLVVFVEDVTSVTEPGMLALFGLGLAGLGAARRRQKG